MPAGNGRRSPRSGSPDWEHQSERLQEWDVTGRSGARGSRVTVVVSDHIPLSPVASSFGSANTAPDPIAVFQTESEANGWAYALRVAPCETIGGLDGTVVAVVVVVGGCVVGGSVGGGVVVAGGSVVGGAMVGGAVVAGTVVGGAVVVEIVVVALGGAVVVVVFLGGLGFGRTGPWCGFLGRGQAASGSAAVTSATTTSTSSASARRR
jgi:hypothetical protein